MLDYPGLGFPVRYDQQLVLGQYPIGAHGSCVGSESDLLPIRELAMMSIMERLTDKQDWEKKVYDEDIVTKWRKEAMAIPDEELLKLAISKKSQRWAEDGTLIIEDDWSAKHFKKKIKGIVTPETFDTCIEELRNKAQYYERSGLVPTLDACASIVKSDRLIGPELGDDLREAFRVLKKDQLKSPDYHPNTKDMVQDLVHPSMYPLVYGRSKVLKNEVVGVGNAIYEWAGKGEIIPKEDHDPDSSENSPVDYVGSADVPPNFWSSTYQWLPANVSIQEDGSVKFSSYINGLHPEKFPNIYATIERLIETALPAWDQCLAVTVGHDEKVGAGRLKSRFPYPEDPDDGNAENWVPSTPGELADAEVDWNEIDYDEEWDDKDVKKWEYLRQPRIPEARFAAIEYTPVQGMRLVDKYAKSGLQVIVKMASIELTPEKPEFPVGGWHVEGQMNEHICATALYYLDSDNITTSELSFRMQTSAYMEDKLRVGQDAYYWLEAVYGTGLGGGNSPCLQNYGSIETRQGRLLVFPNIFQHRVSGFRLQDPTKPGHRRFIALWLVDPTQRIISTANVPPQQFDWWSDSAFGSIPETREAALSKLPAELVSLIKAKGLDSQTEIANEGSLPPEIMEMVRKHFEDDGDPFLMGADEAREHRLKLMEERSAFVKNAESEWQQHTYNFCEH